jgi:hypothetical protein
VEAVMQVERNIHSDEGFQPRRLRVETRGSKPG